MGMYRFYMTPAGLIKQDDLPEGWGLLEVVGRSVKVVQQSARHEHSQTNEMNILWSECRKIQIVKKGGNLDTVAGRRIAQALA
jgi:hypothetical protein